MGGKKLANLIVDKLCNRISDALVKTSVICFVVSAGLFLYSKSKTYYGEKHCSCCRMDQNKSLRGLGVGAAEVPHEN